MQIVSKSGNGLETHSRFRLIVMATQRAKQLLHGSKPRIEGDPCRRKHTSIALEEVKRGLINIAKPATAVTQRPTVVFLSSPSAVIDDSQLR